MAMRVECRCGKRLSNYEGNEPVCRCAITCSSKEGSRISSRKISITSKARSVNMWNKWLVPGIIPLQKDIETAE